MLFSWFPLPVNALAIEFVFPQTAAISSGKPRPSFHDTLLASSDKFPVPSSFLRAELAPSSEQIAPFYHGSSQVEVVIAQCAFPW